MIYCCRILRNFDDAIHLRMMGMICDPVQRWRLKFLLPKSRLSCEIWWFSVINAISVAWLALLKLRLLGLWASFLIFIIQLCPLAFLFLLNGAQKRLVFIINLDEFCCFPSFLGSLLLLQSFLTFSSPVNKVIPMCECF